MHRPKKSKGTKETTLAPATDGNVEEDADEVEVSSVKSPKKAKKQVAISPIKNNFAPLDRLLQHLIAENALVPESKSIFCVVNLLDCLLIDQT
jgi:hypothetical protein